MMMLLLLLLAVVERRHDCCGSNVSGIEVQKEEMSVCWGAAGAVRRRLDTPEISRSHAGDKTNDDGEIDVGGRSR